jgi:hypothetical protein
VAAIELRNPRRELAGWTFLRRLASLLGGLLAVTGARAIDLPEDRADALLHSYVGGGVNASGPALLVRKSVMDKVSLSASYYLDAVSNASIDVVTTASKFRENRSAYGLGADYVYRDSQITLAGESSREPDYIANRVGMDISQEVFGGMTTVKLGFTRGADEVYKTGSPEFSSTADHWIYRLGITQILTPRVVAALNMEARADEGFLGSPYRKAVVFGASVPERVPTTRSGRAVSARLIGDLGSRDSARVAYRYFWDTWNIKANTLEAGYSRYFGDKWLGDAFARYYTQTGALFYSNNAKTETTYVSRNRQLSTFKNYGLGANLGYVVKTVPGQYEVKVNGAYEFIRFQYSDFTTGGDGTGGLYAFNANVFQLYVSATF